MKIIWQTFIASLLVVYFSESQANSFSAFSPKKISLTDSNRCPDQKAKVNACVILALRDIGAITLWNRHPSGVKDNATSLDNIKDACDGKAVSRSNYTCKECPDPGAPGGKVCLKAILLEYILELHAKVGYIHEYHQSQFGPISDPTYWWVSSFANVISKQHWQVNEIAGACHTCHSKHYLGRAVDIDMKTTEKASEEMVKICENMGGQGLNEKTHIHCQFDKNW